ncbi:MAG: TlpA disulfide reductase family protein [Planctomycetia bacterium]|nr:TlpA disulfide reductase family protein [Planctomycetia bacterium]
MRKITSIAWTLALGGCLGLSAGWSEELPTPEKAAEKIEAAVEEKALEAEAETKREIAEEAAAEATEEGAEAPAVPIPFQMPQWKMVTDEELTEALKLPEKATAEELLQFIRDTDSLRPANLEEKDPAKQEAQVKAFLAKVFEARIAAADKMLEDTELSAELKRTALSIQVMSLLTLSQIDPANAEKLYALAEELRKGDDKELSWSVDAMLIQYEMSQTKEMPTAEEYQSHVKKLLDHMKKGIEWKCLDQAFVGTVAQVVMISEQMLPVKEAVAVFNQFLEVLRSSEEKPMQQLADSLESVKKRLEMTGQVLDYTFQGMDGKAIPVKDFAGKNLLIVFWAISDQNSLEEIPLLMQLYDFYHEKGLEVIAVTVDEDNDELRQMLEKVGFKWNTVVNLSQKDAEGEEKVVSPAEYFGITSLPLKIFVGTDGKVVSANMPLMELLDTLEKAYGPLPKESTEEVADEAVEKAIDEAVEETVEEVDAEKP